MTWPYEQEWEDFKAQFEAYKAGAANVVNAAAAFTSGTTKTTDAGFEDCHVGTIIITTVSSAVTVYIVTAVAEDEKITGKQISNAA
ncbi:hypothetical protein [Cloacibacillus evryensis]|uniref:hypothetical protein n=1 Tax=Cloacibacillus evryensis TaxID=508460 RepID=UPI00241CD36F|nr:hypothetical protein [Cloacibacillus evryensis]